ncbi:MAG TPA: nicotinamide-nucleotide amidohydrolase family protein, partial [Bacteroidota bacterium]|nr:nicotinamide-nucleotide amidohydrolase family protein [Bacteroidota bacterium]
LPSPLGVNLRLSVIDSDPQAAQSKVSAMESSIQKKADKFIYGVDDETLEEIVGRLLRERKLTIAIAESCTGGIIAHRISNVPGCSEYFERGIIAYSNQSKIDILQVPQELIEKHGAVSEEVVKSMALGVRQIAETDIGLSTTGIAGPTGGTAEKPVGLVWIGYSDKNGTIALKHHFGDNRLRVKERSAQAALNLVRKRLLQIE